MYEALHLRKGGSAVQLPCVQAHFTALLPVVLNPRTYRTFRPNRVVD
jgi:hypothetical protein